LIFYTSNHQGIDCERQSVLEKHLGTIFWLLGGLGSAVGELPDGGRQSDASGAPTAEIRGFARWKLPFPSHLERRVAKTLGPPAAAISAPRRTSKYAPGASLTLGSRPGDDRRRPAVPASASPASRPLSNNASLAGAGSSGRKPAAAPRRAQALLTTRLRHSTKPRAIAALVDTGRQSLSNERPLKPTTGQKAA